MNYVICVDDEAKPIDETMETIRNTASLAKPGRDHTYAVVTFKDRKKVISASRVLRDRINDEGLNVEVTIAIDETVYEQPWLVFRNTIVSCHDDGWRLMWFPHRLREQYRDRLERENLKFDEDIWL